MTTQTIDEMLEVMTAFKNGKKIQTKTISSDWADTSKPEWYWNTQEYRIKPEVDLYAELKAASVDPTKQIRCNDAIGIAWQDVGYPWKWGAHPESYEIRDKPDPYAELKAAADNPNKQIRIKGKAEWYGRKIDDTWRDSTHPWKWHYLPEEYEIRDRHKEDKKPSKKYTMLAWFDGYQIVWRPDYVKNLEPWMRVSGQDFEMELNDDQ